MLIPQTALQLNDYNNDNDNMNQPEVYQKLKVCINSNHKDKTTRETDELGTLYCNTETSYKFREQLLFRLFAINKTHIKKVLLRYINLDACNEASDLYQLSIESLITALNDYRKGTYQNETSGMSFSTFLYWRIQRTYQNNNKGKDKTVDIFDADGNWKNTMDYTAFKYRRAQLKSEGYTWAIKTRTVYFSDMETEPAITSYNYTEDALIANLDKEIMKEKSRGNK